MKVLVFPKPKQCVSRPNNYQSTLPLTLLQWIKSKRSNNTHARISFSSVFDGKIKFIYRRRDHIRKGWWRAKHYFYATDICLISVFWANKNVCIDRDIVEPGHGNSLGDKIKAYDKKIWNDTWNALIIHMREMRE